MLWLLMLQWRLMKLDWEMYYLGGNYQLASPPHMLIKNLFQTNSVLTAHAYAVNYTVFDFIIKQGTYPPIIDIFYNKHVIPRGKVYHLNPIMCIQTPGHSDIMNKQVDYTSIVRVFNSLMSRRIRSALKML